MKKVFLMGALALSGPACVWAQPAIMTSPETSEGESVVQKTTMPNLPTELKFSALDKSWRRFTSRSKDANANNMYGSWGPQYEQVLNDLGIGVHFTKGDNITIGKESYLVAYRVDPGFEPQDLQQEIQQRMQAFWGHGEQQAPPRPAGKFAPDAKLKLSLLNLRSVGNLEDLRTFESKRDLLSPKDLRELSSFNLRRLGIILIQYGRYQGLPLRDINAVRQMMRNQHSPVSLLRNPADNETYHFNTSLNGKKTDSIGNKKLVVIAYEATPSTDNTRGVLFVDGHVERVAEWKWSKVRAAKPSNPTAKEYRVLSANQLKQIFGQLTGFARMRRRLPNTSDSTKARQEIMSIYGANQPLFQEPQTRQFYRFNPAISSLQLDAITNKSQLVAIYEPAPSADGTRAALFLDGVVRRIDRANWKTIIGRKAKLKKA